MMSAHHQPGGPPLRKGKWTDEENAYVHMLVVSAARPPGASSAAGGAAAAGRKSSAGTVAAALGGGAVLQHAGDDHALKRVRVAPLFWLDVKGLCQFGR